DCHLRWGLPSPTPRVVAAGTIPDREIEVRALPDRCRRRSTPSSSRIGAADANAEVAVLLEPTCAARDPIEARDAVPPAAKSAAIRFEVGELVLTGSAYTVLIPCNATSPPASPSRHAGARHVLAIVERQVEHRGLAGRLADQVARLDAAVFTCHRTPA